MKLPVEKFLTLTAVLATAQLGVVACAETTSTPKDGADAASDADDKADAGADADIDEDSSGVDAGATVSACGADAWYCMGDPPSPDATPLYCRENGAGPFSSAENLARSGCGDRAQPGGCPAPTTRGGACTWMTGNVCFVDVNYVLDETQRQTARNSCLGTWADGVLDPG